MTKSGKHMGRGSNGKGDGTGGMTDAPINEIEPNKVLSNRDKAQHTRERGQDSKWVETEELKDHSVNRGGG